MCMLVISVFVSLFFAKKLFKRIEKMTLLSAQFAHDIHSPLAAMEMIIKSFSDKESKSFHELLKEAIQNVRDMANNYLDYFRYPAKPDQMHSVMLTSMIDTLIAQKKQEWKKHPCDIIFINLLPESLSRIKILPNDIRPLLSNLLNNAYEALQSERQIKMILSMANDFIKLDIEDKGRGIPENKIEAVLSGLSLKHEGKGLGLSTAKKFMELIGGRLSIVSVQGEGTTVSLWFPITLSLFYIP